MQEYSKGREIFALRGHDDAGPKPFDRYQLVRKRLHARTARTYQEDDEPSIEQR